MPEEPAKLDQTLDARPYEPPKPRSLTNLYVALGIVVVLGLLGGWLTLCTSSLGGEVITDPGAHTKGPAPAENNPKKDNGEVKKSAIVYDQWPCDETEAKRRQKETADSLGVTVERSVDVGGEVKLELVLVPAGEFEMGGDESPEEVAKKCGGIKASPAWFKPEQPQHRVRITKPFWMGKYEVTQEVWEKVMGKNPSGFKGARNPVEQVSWNDCQKFLKKLNESSKEKGEFLLPTEAQWEYACRAGTKTPFHFGETASTDQANYDGGYTYGGGRKGDVREKTVAVGSFPANSWGLHDMHGNVLEWCSDRYGADYYERSPKDDPTGPAIGFYRVIRVGSWAVNPWTMRSAYRSAADPDDRRPFIGLRVAVCEWAPKPSQPVLALTDKQCQEFAQKIEASINAGDPKVFDAAMDVNELVTRAIVGLAPAPGVERDFRAGMANSFRLGAVIVNSVKGGGNYKLLRIRQGEGNKLAVFRMLTNSGGMNYHELSLEPAGDGEIRMVDCYVYLTGEPMSKTLRRTYLRMVAQSNSSLLAKLAGWESEYTKNLPLILEMTELTRTGKYKDALAIYSRMPAGLQSDRNVLTIRLQSSYGLYNAGEGDKEYVAAMADFQKHYTGDACLMLILIDYHFIRKEYDKAFESIESLDKSVGGDPYLKCMRGNTRLSQDKLEEAEKFYQQALQEEPELMAVHNGLLTLSIKRKNFKETARLLTRLENDFRMSFAHLKGIPDYAEFLKSPEGAKWAEMPSATPTAPGKQPTTGSTSP